MSSPSFSQASKLEGGLQVRVQMSWENLIFFPSADFRIWMLESPEIPSWFIQSHCFPYSRCDSFRAWLLESLESSPCCLDLPLKFCAPDLCRADVPASFLSSGHWSPWYPRWFSWLSCSVLHFHISVMLYLRETLILHKRFTDPLGPALCIRLLNLVKICIANLMDGEGSLTF